MGIRGIFPFVVRDEARNANFSAFTAFRETNNELNLIYNHIDLKTHM